MPNIPGLTESLADRYAIDREIGAGGMATVYLARDLKHDRKVALKVLREDLSASLGKERFLREIKIAAGLQHPHVLPLYDSGEANGLLYYVMPFVDGMSLRERLEREGEFPVADAVRILRDVADALSAAHKMGIVHRDLKPENVMISGWHALVTDFGVAKALSEATGSHTLTTAGVALGTPTYMAPEQAAADPHVDHRADIYAFGVLAYELLAGRPPFLGTAQHVLAAHVTEMPDPLTRHRGALPPALESLVMKCLEKRPADRWQSVVEMIPMLEAVQTPGAGTTPASAASRRSNDSASGRRWRMGVMSLLAVVLVAAVWIAVKRLTGGPKLSANLVVVLPFRVSGGDAKLSELREGMLDMLATYLTGEGGTPQSADPGAVISAWKHRVKTESEDLTQPDAEKLARELGAARLLTGSVVGSGTRLLLRGTLAGVDGKPRPVQASVEGPADSLITLIPRFVGQLLARSAGMATDESASLTTNSLPALRAYLRGQLENRRGRYAEAVDAFTEALATDSDFALAGAGLLTANSWGAGGEVQPRVLEVARLAAWRGRAKLAPKDRAIVTAVLGPNGLDPSEGVAELHAREQATVVASDRAEAWYLLGDWHLHFGALVGMDDGLRRGEEELQRSLARDSANSGVLQHLLLLAALRRDTSEIRRLVQRFEAATSDPVAHNMWRWFAGTNLGDSTMRRAALRGVDTLRGDLVPFRLLAGSLPAETEHVAEIRELLARLDRRLTETNAAGIPTRARAFLELDAGRPQAAQRLLTEQTVQADAVRVLAALFWSGDSAGGAAAAARLAARPTTDSSMMGAVGTGYSPACAQALWQADRGDADAIGPAIRQLRAQDAKRSPALPMTRNQVCAAVLAAMVAQRTHEGDAPRLIDQVDALLLRAPYRSINWENLAAARLLENEGQYERAAAAARRYTYFYTYPQFLATHLRESGRLAERAGDKARAIKAYSRYLELRSDPEPPVAAEVAQVRQALAKLTGEKGSAAARP